MMTRTRPSPTRHYRNGVIKRPMSRSYLLALTLFVQPIMAAGEVYYVGPNGTNSDSNDCNASNPCEDPQWVIFRYMMSGTNKQLVILDGSYDIANGSADWELFNPRELASSYADWDDFATDPTCQTGTCNGGYRDGNMCGNDAACRLDELATRYSCSTDDWWKWGQCADNDREACNNDNDCAGSTTCEFAKTAIFIPPNTQCTNCTIVAETVPAEPGSPAGIRDSMHNGETEDSDFGAHLLDDDGINKCFVVNGSDWAVRGFYCGSSNAVTICNADDHTMEYVRVVRDTFDQGIRGPINIHGSSDVTLRWIDAHHEDYACWVESNRDKTPGEPIPRLFGIRDIDGLTIEDSAFWGTPNLSGGLTNVDDVTIRRSRIEHWTHHGFILESVRGFLFETTSWAAHPGVIAGMVVTRRLCKTQSAMEPRKAPRIACARATTAIVKTVVVVAILGPTAARVESSTGRPARRIATARPSVASMIAFAVGAWGEANRTPCAGPAPHQTTMATQPTGSVSVIGATARPVSSSSTKCIQAPRLAVTSDFSFATTHLLATDTASYRFFARALREATVPMNAMAET